MMKRKSIRNALAAMLGFLLIFSVNLETARAGKGDVDIYVIFSGKNKKDKSALKKALPADISVKFYNVDLLAVADYSGKQKAVAKLDRARLVLVIKDNPMDLLDGSVLKSKLLILQSAKTTLYSENQTLYVVGKGTEPSGIGGKTITAANETDLADVGDSKIIVIDEATLDIFKAAAIIANKMLGP